VQTENEDRAKSHTGRERLLAADQRALDEFACGDLGAQLGLELGAHLLVAKWRGGTGDERVAKVQNK
jgi:hypothetical protein